MKVLEVGNITKSFGKHKAVDNVSFSLDEGVVFGLIGPNGAGKTTTIRMIMNIIMPDSGNVSVLGKSDTKTSTDLIGYLPEERGLYRKMQVKDLLRFMTDLKSVPKHKAVKEIDYWLDKVGLSDWKKKKIEELSKGMQQKIQFIGTILHQPKLLILDEPFGGLDPINQELIKDLLLELKSKGTTIIFSTHVMESAEKLCEVIFLMNKGKQVLHDKLGAIKKNVGREHIHIEYEGNDDFLKNSSQIKKFTHYGNGAEIQLTEKGNAQKLLKEAMQAVTIKSFAIKEPSLHEIFIDVVGEASETEEAV